MNLIFLGPQGSGKGTQVELLCNRFHLIHFEMGQILRDMVNKKDDLGREISLYLDKGLLVPDEVILKVIKLFLSEDNLRQGVVFDGFPRSLPQAKIFEEELFNRKALIDKVVVLNISKEESLRRLGGRRICPQCGKIYNLITLSHNNKEICDDCKEKLIVRSDETPEAIAQRLKIYEETTVPVIEYYRGKGKVIEINGERPVEVIFKDILNILTPISNLSDPSSSF